MLGVPDLELEKQLYNCVYCHTKLRAGQRCPFDETALLRKARRVCVHCRRAPVAAGRAMDVL
jgi:hypothetical protein